MRTIFLSLIFCSVLAGSAFAYDIEQLIADAEAYHSARQQEIGDMTMELTASFEAKGSGESSMKSVHYQKGDKWRSEANMNMDASGSNANGSLSAITLFDGADYWTVTMGMKMKLPPEQVGDQKTSDYWHAPPEGSTIIGDETVNGRDCWIVQYPENPMMKEAPRYWIDKEKFVFVRTVSELSGKEIRSDFSDFRTVKGDFEIPYHIDVYSGEDKTMTADVTKLEIGTGLSDELFDASKLAGGGMPGMGGGEIDIEQLMKQAEEMKKQYGGGEGE